MDNMDLTIELAIPFLGTTLGATMVFFMRNKLSLKIEELLLGFASGVMIAASVWLLIVPSIDMAKEQGKIEWLPAAVGFILGIVFLLLLDSLIPHLHLNDDKPEGMKAKLKKTTMMVFAVTLHNIPEGMAVGVTFAGAIIGNTETTMAGAFALALGIAIQNFPEGAISSMLLKSEGMSKPKAFLCGMISGIVEPIVAIITILLTNIIVPFLPYLLSFAAGAMIYVVIKELILESQTGELSKIATIGVVLFMIFDIVTDDSLTEFQMGQRTIGVAIGFILMTILAVALV
jgi:ZIP family zinc transporter